MASSRIRIIQSVDNFRTLLQSYPNNLIIIDFTAKWCGPCRTIAPQFEKLSLTHEDILFAKVDVDIVSDLASTLNIQTIPTFLIIRNGNELARVNGANFKQLQESILYYYTQSS